MVWMNGAVSPAVHRELDIRVSEGSKCQIV